MGNLDIQSTRNTQKPLKPPNNQNAQGNQVVR